jgi:hypothetical protein
MVSNFARRVLIAGVENGRVAEAENEMTFQAC